LLKGLTAPDYPIAYDAGKALAAAAKARGLGGFGAQWAGQGAPLARALPAAALVEALVDELQAVQGRDGGRSTPPGPRRGGRPFS
jgi:nitronate monooxygenase